MIEKQREEGRSQWVTLGVTGSRVKGYVLSKDHKIWNELLQQFLLKIIQIQRKTNVFSFPKKTMSFREKFSQQLLLAKCVGVAGGIELWGKPQWQHDRMQEGKKRKKERKICQYPRILSRKNRLLEETNCQNDGNPRVFPKNGVNFFLPAMVSFHLQLCGMTE